MTIPARNEERAIVDALGSIATQTATDCFLVIVFANNCNDETARKAREFAESRPQLRLHIAEGHLSPPFDHVGTARKALMDYAAERFFEAGRPRGIMATTDADTCVARDWVAETLIEMRHADAVAGLVEIGAIERRNLPPAVRALYAQENAFRRAWAKLEALIDPVPEDPFPRHCSFVGASFAVTAEIYRRAGGLPEVPALEDRIFLHALRRVDARVRFSRKVRAATSGRPDGRVEGGFGTLVKHLYTQGAHGGTLLVENPCQIFEEAQSRAALRRIWRGSCENIDMTIVCKMFETTPEQVQQLIDDGRPFGENYEALEKGSNAADRAYPLVPVGEAIEGLHALAAAAKAAAPTRSRAASGAG
ncbi:MAG TPA: glycosyltransferase [Candidatus Tumulicola sp.]